MDSAETTALSTLGTADRDARAAVQREAQIAAAAAGMVDAYSGIDCDDMCQLATDEMNDIRAKKNALNEQRMKITRPMDVAKQEVMALFAPHLRVLENAELRIKGFIGVYLDKKEEERRAEEARLQAAERERQRLAAEEAQRERERADAAAAEQRKVAEAAEAAGHLEAAALARANADAAQQQGQTKAEEVLREASHAPAVIVPQTKMNGASQTGTWRGELTSKLDCMRYIVGLDGETLKAIQAAGIVIKPKAEYLSVFTESQSAINAIARSQQTDCVVPGIRTIFDRSVRGTGKR